MTSRDSNKRVTDLDLTSPVVAQVLEVVSGDNFAIAVASRAGTTVDLVRPKIDDIASEAELALELLQSIGPLTEEMRILEVGAGPGVVSGILHALGADLVAIEPVQSGWELFSAVRAELAEQVPQAAAPIQGRAAEELNPEADGTFDLIFSVNVLEHCQPLEPSLDAIATVLSPQGRMLHTCPNYRVPYEPHYAMPLVPFRPRLTPVLRPSLKTEPLWQSLNFITARDIKAFAARANLDLNLRAGVLGRSIDRLQTDPAFARRQGFVGRVLAAISRTGVLNWIHRLPPAWVTPMVIEVGRRAD